ncbi:MAG: T9SS type A sorting domain-containing protein [Candidatus Eiseniibacteriota bacterium]|nr:MAG: T9SS type A sorting domain-containing protein [Candidatus Eisenbacteria bacterium]
MTLEMFGGIIVTWTQADASYNVYAQRVHPAGELSWAPEGVPICATGANQESPKVIHDGSGGAFIAWLDDRGTGYSIYGQHVDMWGNLTWNPDGVPICTVTVEEEGNFQMAPLGYGGAVIAWEDTRRGLGTDIFAQRVDVLGNVLWPFDGIPVCTTAGNQEHPTIMPVGPGRVVIGWQDDCNGADWDIYSQCVDMSGELCWMSGGVPVCLEVGNQSNPTMASGEGGSVIVTWNDSRSGANYDIYAQLLDVSGNIVWPAEGMPVCTTAGDQFGVRITSDGEGGAIFTWNDGRVAEGDIYAQRLDEYGGSMWTENGVPVCGVSNIQWLPCLISDGTSGAIIAWEDRRDSGNADIYAQRIREDGGILPPFVPDPYHSYVEWANLLCGNEVAFVCPCGGGSHIYVSLRDEYGQPMNGAEVTVGFMADCDMCRCEPVSAVTDVNGEAELYIHAGLDATGGTECCSVTTIVQSMNVTIPWWIPGQGPSTDTREWFSADLNGDCVVDGTDDYLFLEDYEGVACRTDYVCSGFVDIADYSFFWTHYDHVCSSVIEVQQSRAVLSPQSKLVGNHPNPFNPMTRIRFVVSRSGRVVLRVFDIGGRPVRTLLDAWRDAKGYEVTWDGRDDMGNPIASGIYFLKLEAPGHTETKKMVLIR